MVVVMVVLLLLGEMRRLLVTDRGRLPAVAILCSASRGLLWSAPTEADTEALEALLPLLLKEEAPLLLNCSAGSLGKAPGPCSSPSQPPLGPGPGSSQAWDSIPPGTFHWHLLPLLALLLTLSLQLVVPTECSRTVTEHPRLQKQAMGRDQTVGWSVGCAAASTGRGSKLLQQAGQAAASSLSFSCCLSPLGGTKVVEDCPAGERIEAADASEKGLRWPFHTPLHHGWHLLGRRFKASLEHSRQRSGGCKTARARRPCPRCPPGGDDLQAQAAAGCRRQH
mmetsp:Transcript_13487/g.38308  ORF Transcript_13487/g.38308 Transcript_13487/m.38308 type:complete len:280 (+) Transcript_13487:1177-2016(+)